MPTAFNKIDGWFGDQDYRLYQDAVQHFQDGAVFVELGAFKGRSTFAMAQLIANSGKRIKFYTVDHFKGSVEHAGRRDLDTLFETFQRNLGDYLPLVTVCKANTCEALSLVHEPVDFVYIDAAHDAESVMRDVVNWHGKLAPGAWLGGHDWDLQTVRDGVSRGMRQLGYPQLHPEEYEASWVFKQLDR